jgi:hypothetical protein
MSPVKYELGFYIPEDAILHSHCRENRKYNINTELQNYVNTSWARRPHVNEQKVEHRILCYSTRNIQNLLSSRLLSKM